MTVSANQIAEAVRLLEKLRTASEEAASAALTGDLDAVEAALRERQNTIARLDPLLTPILDPGGEAPSDELRPVLDELLEASQQTHDADERLRSTLHHERRQLADRLDRIDGQEAIHAAYGHSPRQPATMNRLLR